jgi:hypothetical protein
VATVRQEVARLGRILRELVDFARRRRDEATLVSVQSVVGDALRLLRHDRRMREVTVREEFDPETPPVFVIEDHLMQVVLNLLLNALDAMPAGGTLRFVVGTAGGQVALRVHDTGVGMDRAVLARCFEPLFTTKDPTAAPGSASASAATSLAPPGDIEMHSAPGRHDCRRHPARLCDRALPRGRPSRAGRLWRGCQRPLVSADRAGPPRRGRARAARRARPVLDRRGYAVTAVGSGEQALERCPEPYAVLLTDLRLAGMDGLAVVRRARRGTRRWAFSS